MSLPNNVQKYLKKYSPNKWSLVQKNQALYDNIVVIPSLAEFDNNQRLLNSITKNDTTYFPSTLFMFVINNTVSASDEVKSDNHKSIQFLDEIIFGKNNSENDSISLSKLNLAYVDASSTGKEMDDKNGGVGLARKLGMDIALQYFDYGNSNKKILICLDSDCTISENYLSSIVKQFNSENISAAAINFEHNLDHQSENTAAIICYELFLRYYVLGLTFADSDYAFHTIGSSMACDYESYIKIEGMNKRKAAEDFYFIEKLSKITDIKQIKNAVVYPSSRPSLRVPFGTGQRVTRYLSHQQDEYLLYNPKCFIVLKYWLTQFRNANDISADAILNNAKSVDDELFNFLISQNFSVLWNNLKKQNISQVQIDKQKKIWFDGFRTLKLIHHLRDDKYGLINMFDALDELFLLCNIDVAINRSYLELPTLDIQKKYLLLMRQLQNKFDI